MTLTQILDAVDWCMWNVLMPTMLVIIIAITIFGGDKKEKKK